MVEIEKNKEQYVEKTKAPSFAKIAWSEICNDKIAFVSLIIFAGIVLTVAIGSLIIDENALQIVNIKLRNTPPSLDFILGTDPSGRSVMQLLIIGAKNSLLIAFFVTSLGVGAGMLVGVFAGYYGGMVDNIIMRIVDFFTILPRLMLIIVLVTLKYDYNMFDFILIMSIFSWPFEVRLIRSKVLQQANLDYASASKTLGTPNILIIFREIVPNITSIMVVNLTLALAGNIGLETGLTFLGFGLKFTTPSLGSMLFHATNVANLSTRPWIWLPASLLVLTLMLCINFIGQAINRASDAKQRGA
jgi:peptide/nickel transport system permease protein